MVLLHILLAFSCQLLAVSCQQTSCTVPEPVEGTTSSISTSSAISYPTTVDRCLLTVDYYESQICLADSLYKNYLPQYNFEEVKAAVGFFDSLRLSTDNSQQTLCKSDAYPRTVDCCPLTVDIEFLCARAHYYHAVGLTERDDIVGACEHYLTALEIMEEMMAKDKGLKAKGKEKEKAHGSQLIAHSSKKSVDRCLLTVDNPEDYEKIRFMALTYTRLGRLFYNEAYCDLAILKYKKALEYLEKLGNNEYKANILKEIGNTYQLYSQPDSALYYYNKSLRISSNLTNILDVEKSVAQILFEKGEKDSAYILIKNNLDKIENTNVKYSYYNILGEMYIEDKEYDSAIYYLGISIKSNILDIKFNSAIKLSTIYDSIDDSTKKNYYDDIVSKISIININKGVETNKLQDVYDRYKERKNEKERLENIREKKLIIISLSSIVILILILTLLIMYKSKRKENVLTTAMSEMKKDIIDKETIINRISEEIKQKDSEMKRHSQEIEDNKKNIDILRKEIETNKQEISNRESVIKKLEKDLTDKRNKLEIIISDIDRKKKELVKLKRKDERNDQAVTLKDYYDSDICRSILNRKKSDFTVLSEDELALLLEAADKHLGNITKSLRDKYPRLRKEDLNCICLILLNISPNRLHYLLGRNRKTIWERINRIKDIMNIGDKKDLFLSLKEELYR